MRRDLLSHLPVVRAVAECGGFAAAASRFGMSPSAVSHAVKTVEEQLGLPLFARTTRSVSLTEAGSSFLAAIGLALTAIMAEMARRHPDLRTELAIDDSLVDIVSGEFDAGIRLGEMIAADMIAVRLTPPFKAILVAAPCYLEARGEPRSIADLASHNCVAFRLATGGGIYAWGLKDEEGADVSVRVRGTVVTSDPLYTVDLALAGLGIAYVFEPLVRAQLREGRLRWLMPETSVEQPGLFLYFPRGASEAPKLRAFIDAVRDVFNADSRPAGEPAVPSPSSGV